MGGGGGRGGGEGCVARAAVARAVAAGVAVARTAVAGTARAGAAKVRATVTGVVVGDGGERRTGGEGLARAARVWTASTTHVDRQRGAGVREERSATHVRAGARNKWEK